MNDEIETIIQAFRSLRGTSVILNDDWELDFLREKLQEMHESGNGRGYAAGYARGVEDAQKNKPQLKQSTPNT